MSRQHVSKLIYEMAELLPVRAAVLQKEALGRPAEEAAEILDAAAGMTRLYGRLTARARRRWKTEREKETQESQVLV
jgi:hypothetical protein